MKPSSIIVGLGFGQLYKQALQDLGINAVTVDSDLSKQADFTDIGTAVSVYKNFVSAHICTPNFTHEQIAKTLAPYCKIIFVEKPGVRDANSWISLAHDFKKTKFVMVKNNQWRDNIDRLRELAAASHTVDIKWINNDRVPNPGTWFTTKKLAYGGVSRDLMPHLLSIFLALEPSWNQATIIKSTATKNWNLADLTKTDYGVVNPQGTYDVDDYCSISFSLPKTVWNLTADWRSKNRDELEIVFHLPHDQPRKNSSKLVTIELGLCPESAYKNMIYDCIANLTNSKFWEQQLEQDCYIHERIQDFEI